MSGREFQKSHYLENLILVNCGDPPTPSNGFNCKPIFYNAGNIQ